MSPGSGPPATARSPIELREAPGLRLLEAMPDLGDGLNPERFSAAREAVVVTSAVLEPRGQGAIPADDDPLGASVLIVEGLLLRRVTIEGRRGSELLGPGDVVRPWDQDAVAGLPSPASVLWQVIDPTRVVFIDTRLIGRAAPYPEVLGNLLSRAVRRSQSLAVHLALSSMPRVDDRLWVLFWHLADRWGAVTPAGVRLDLRLTHELLAELVGARRPTVTSALAALGREGRIVRGDDGAWLLPR